jgi:hypothetical protein
LYISKSHALINQPDYIFHFEGNQYVQGCSKIIPGDKLYPTHPLPSHLGSLIQITFIDIFLNVAPTLYGEADMWIHLSAATINLNKFEFKGQVQNKS